MYNACMYLLCAKVDTDDDDAFLGCLCTKYFLYVDRCMDYAGKESLLTTNAKEFAQRDASVDIHASKYVHMTSKHY
jgi:hypothetical protein